VWVIETYSRIYLYKSKKKKKKKKRRKYFCRGGGSLVNIRGGGGGGGDFVQIHGYTPLILPTCTREVMISRNEDDPSIRWVASLEGSAPSPKAEIG